MGIKLNMKDAGGDFDPLPNGAYPCNITDCECKKSNSSEHDNLNFTLTVCEGPFEKRKLFYLLPLHPNCRYRVKQFIEAANDEKLTADEIDFDPKDFFGKKVTALVQQEEYEGDMKNRVRNVKPYKPLTETTKPASPAGRRSRS